ncbi:MAG: pseudouridine synthase [candidate division KSB1 bacterium]|nr:pseudouridine synthase [candidate division KSB1 bacterium]
MIKLKARLRMMRINKYLAACGFGSRRSVEALITSGQVKINGKPVSDLSVQVNEEKDSVYVNDKKALLPNLDIYILLNKPRGYITTNKDERGRKSVIDLVDIKQRIFPVGRLDAQSEGLLLLTNDGEMANRLMHPRYKFSKIYRVKLDKPLDRADFLPIVKGIELEDGKTAPAKARWYTDEPDRVEIVLKEGKNRQIRRMFETLGYSVKSLKRITYGPLKLSGVKRGEWRYLNANEIRELKQQTCT